MIPLSILDLSVVTTGTRPAAALRNSIDLAREADALGYVRYWLAEHHNLASVASPAPDLMIGQIAAVTSRIRVGSGGVMLPNHAPLMVAERFKMLEALFPGRIDLGLGRAPGTDGATAHGVKIDLWDVVALNAAEEWSYYVKYYDKQHGIQTASLGVPEHCSAFVATGSYTKDGKAVIAHNNWTGYLDGERWTIIYDITPAMGKRMLMDGLPGVIHSADDFVTNSAGITITETTIGHFSGYDPAAIPEFVRARKAAQYSASIDDFARIMKDGNNGGYANTWLIADINRNEIGRLELGLTNVTLEKKTDGYFVGSNFPINESLIKEETDFDPKDMSQSATARHVRWEQLMAQNKGKIDVAAAQRFLADHYDTYEKKEDADERTLDGHIDLSPRGSGDWMPPYGIAGAVQNKAADAAMIGKISFTAAAGHACGKDFKAAKHLQAHPEFDWQKDLQRNMDAHPWTSFSVTN